MRLTIRRTQNCWSVSLYSMSDLIIFIHIQYQQKNTNSSEMLRPLWTSGVCFSWEAWHGHRKWAESQSAGLILLIKMIQGAAAISSWVPALQQRALPCSPRLQLSHAANGCVPLAQGAMKICWVNIQTYLALSSELILIQLLHLCVQFWPLIWLRVVYF